MALDQNDFQLSPEQLALLGQFAVRTGKPPEEVLSEALRQYQPAAVTPSKQLNRESLFDKLNRKGLIGCLSGGPADLSTNPKHVEGFGE